jgi:hypothetical protein
MFCVVINVAPFSSVSYRLPQRIIRKYLIAEMLWNLEQNSFLFRWVFRFFNRHQDLEPDSYMVLSYPTLPTGLNIILIKYTVEKTIPIFLLGKEGRVRQESFF